jgi:diacylglycerol O-acyltransferase / wax synthase
MEGTTLAAHYERLSTLDASFLSFEDRAAHMHVGSVSFLDARPFQREGGGLDFDRIERSMMPIVGKYARLRQKVWWPAGGPAVWIDDPKFDPSFHFRRVAVPSPASERELKTLVSRILSSHLDTTRPLWEAWILEGVSGERFGLVWKIHHCMADGMTVRDILTSYLRFERTSEVVPVAPFVARPAPSVARIHLDEARRRFEKSREATTRMQEFLKSGSVTSSVSDAAAALLQVGANLLGDVAPTPFNGAIGPHRRFDWTSCELGALQEIRKESGAKINDVVLAAVCGAVRRFLVEKDVPVDDLPFRVMVPVSMRAQGDTSGGNRVSTLMVPLPLIETDPRRRLRTIVDTTTRAKASGQSGMGDALLQALDWAGVHPPAPLARLLAEHVPANLVVTNIPGPQRRQFLLESELGEAFSLVPLAAGQGLGIALYSYNGVMHWGFNADRDLLPDLERFVRAVDIELGQLHWAHMPIQVVAAPKRPPVEHAGLANPAADREPGRTSRARPRRKNARVSDPDSAASGSTPEAVAASQNAAS